MLVATLAIVAAVGAVAAQDSGDAYTMDLSTG